MANETAVLQKLYPYTKLFGLLLGPLLFGLCLLMPLPVGMPQPAQAALACTLWIAIWWILEPIPIPVTSLLPILLLPLSGALDLDATTSAYGNPIVFLFMGGFVVALAMEAWNLHKRIALLIILAVGTNQQRLVLGFMLATGFISMWISNTATALMMLPIGMAMVSQVSSFGVTASGANNSLGKALMLGIAYAASIGGLGTLIGTPGNAIFAAIVKELFRQEISFFGWMLMGIPLACLLLLICWLLLTRWTFKLSNHDDGSDAEIRHQLKLLGPMRQEEKAVTVVFLLTAFAWISRSFLLNRIFPMLDDSMIAIAASVLLFLVPARSYAYRRGLITWEIAVKLPWGILLLFGAGLAIAAGFKETGLATYIGQQLTQMQTLPLFLILFTIVLGVNFLTELTSNVATATMMLPILASLAQAIGVHPYGPMVAACLASSCAFMLPVATPPNAVVFGSGYIKMKDMVRAGLWMNLISTLVITLYLYYLLPYLWSINLQ